MSNRNPTRSTGGRPRNDAQALAERTRAMLDKSIKPSLMRKAVKQLAMAIDRGDSWAVTQLLDRAMGKPGSAIPTTRRAVDKTTERMVHAMHYNPQIHEAACELARMVHEALENEPQNAMEKIEPSPESA